MTPFEELLSRSLEIHKKKREDYTTRPDLDPYENFTRANEIISWFPAEYKSFASHIGTKLARLGSLLQTGKTPNNESLDDSFLDLVTYCGLMYGFYYQRKAIGFNVPDHIARAFDKRKTKDSPDPTEPCKHERLNIDRECISCSLSVSKTDSNLFYYRTVSGFQKR